MRLVRRSGRAILAVEEQDFVSGVDERVHGLAQHRRASGPQRGREFGQRDEAVGQKRGKDDLPGRRFRHRSAPRAHTHNVRHAWKIGPHLDRLPRVGFDRGWRARPTDRSVPLLRPGRAAARRRPREEREPRRHRPARPSGRKVLGLKRRDREGAVSLACRRMARDRGKINLRTTDRAVWAPEDALRRFAEPVR